MATNRRELENKISNLRSKIDGAWLRLVQAVILTFVTLWLVLGYATLSEFRRSHPWASTVYVWWVTAPCFLHFIMSVVRLAILHEELQAANRRLSRHYLENVAGRRTQ
ncbi:uncharacterized protein J3R85_008357 [Psidium guajava]|nr:uncharacterized protein J3R85_008357 [Psidium guajava]